MRNLTAGPLGLDPAAFDATAEHVYVSALLSPVMVSVPHAVSSFLLFFVAVMASPPPAGLNVTVT